MAYRLNRITRAGAATATVLAMGFTPLVATAQPSDPPSSSSEALQRYEQLGAQAAKANEELLAAQQDLKRKREALASANAELTRARAAEDAAKAAQERVRERVDSISRATYQGARMTTLSAVLRSESPNAFLDRRTALGVLAADKKAALDTYSQAAARAEQAREAAEQAQRRARAAANAAAKLTEELQRRQANLEEQTAQVRQAMEQLSADKQAELGTVQDTSSYSGPPGAANTALQAALSKRGSEYEWGAEGPNEFDCSGLTSWAYAQAGIDIPRTSRAQYQAGTPVSRSELKPGDLVFYDDGSGDPSQIHHVAMYVAPGKVVGAPTEGQLVDVRSIEGDGHYIGARRYTS